MMSRYIGLGADICQPSGVGTVSSANDHHHIRVLSNIEGRSLALAAPGGTPVPSREELQRLMNTDAGVLRSAESLVRAAAGCAGSVEGDDLASWELRNLVTVGGALCAGALAREESRGCHTRTDYPDRRDDLRLRFIIGG